MSSLTVTEKLHRKARIALRTSGRFAAIRTRDPALFERARHETHARALESLGLAGLYAELVAIQAEEAALARRKKGAQRGMLAVSRGVPPGEVGDGDHVRSGTPLVLPCEAAEALERRQAAHEEHLQADERAGRESARLEAERDRILDVVWLATSPGARRPLGSRGGEVRGDESSDRERAALAIERGRGLTRENGGPRSRHDPRPRLPFVRSRRTPWVTPAPSSISPTSTAA
jgi:hypothetical protein